MPSWSPVRPAATVPSGGVPSLSPAYPAFSLFVCPHPPNPLPSGKGETISLFCRGLRPRHPGIRPLTALTATATAVPGGGRALLVAGSPCCHGTLWGACRLCRLPILPLAYLSAPIPLPPSQREGGIFSFFMQGASPLASPGAGRGAALARRALAVPGGGGRAFFVACQRCL